MKIIEKVVPCISKNFCLKSKTLISFYDTIQRNLVYFIDTNSINDGELF